MARNLLLQSPLIFYVRVLCNNIYDFNMPHNNAITFENIPKNIETIRSLRSHLKKIRQNVFYSTPACFCLFFYLNSTCYHTFKLRACF